MEQLLECALRAEALGWFVLPIDRTEKKPLVKWRERKSRRPTRAEITCWWHRFPDARLGIATGALSGVDVVDFDGPDARARFEARVCDVPDTITQSTGRDPHSFHALFASNGAGLGCKAGLLGCVDLRADGGIVVLAPSPHHNPGQFYRWGKINPFVDGLGDLLEMPPEIIEFFRGPGGEQGRAYQSSRDAQNILRCDFIQWCKNKPYDVSEPLWYAMLSIVASIRPRGVTLCHSLSKNYPGYTRLETNNKILHALDGSRPHTCKFINSNGFKCHSKCRVKSPAGLIYKTGDPKRERKGIKISYR